MAFFKFIGDPRNEGEGPKTISLFGHDFDRDHAVEVKDAAAIRKLEGNSHFEKAEGEAEAKPHKTHKGGKHAAPAE
jgi:hypothetical protein